jgi:hypothetical protein
LKRRWTWIAVAAILLLVGGRIAWVIMRAPHIGDFTKLKTDFQMLGKPHQPEWTAAVRTGRVEDCSADVPNIQSPDWARVTRGEGIDQLLAADEMGGGFLRPHLKWEVRVTLHISDDGEQYHTSPSWEARRSGKCGVVITNHFNEDTRILRLHIIETYAGQSRETTLKFRLTPKGFVAVHDERKR